MNARKIGSVLFSVTVLAALAAAATAAEEKAGVYPVDQGRVVAAAPAGPSLIVKVFSTENTDFGTGEDESKEKKHAVAEQMKSTAPPAMSQSLVTQLQESKAFASVAAFEEGKVPEGALVLEGEFTMLNPGSRGKRYWVGFGAGKSKICVKGRVVDAAGKELVTFNHCRVGVMGWFGGRAEGMMFTDVAATAEKVSAFLTGWSKGEYRP